MSGFGVDLLGWSDEALAKVARLRGWTEPAIERLEIGWSSAESRVVIPVRDETLGDVGKLRYQPDPARLNGQPKMLADKGTPRALFPPPESIGDDDLDDRRTVFLVEGEPDAIRLWSIGIAAVAVPGAQNWKDEWAARLVGRGWKIVVCFDCDQPGRTHAPRAAAGIVNAGGDARLLDLDPREHDGYDLTDFLRLADTPELGEEAAGFLMHLADELELYEPPVGDGGAEEPTNESPSTGLRLRGVRYESIRPVRWLWARRIPCGFPSLLVGEEGVGKGTAVAWLIAQTTRGKLEGDLGNVPCRVLVVGDEDAFEPIWVPRLYAANADLTNVLTLDDGEYLDDLAYRAVDLAAAIRDEAIGLVVFDQLLDHVYGGADGQAIYNPKSVRASMLPLRRVAAATNVAMLGLLHPIKGRVASFRQLIAGSHQFNAVSRSSLLLGVDPTDERRRILVRGKGNHSAIPRSFEFAIAAEVVELNGHSFEVPRVVAEGEGDRTINDLLSPPDAAPVRDELVVELRGVLGPEPRGTGALAEAVGRDAKDGSVRNALAWMVEQGEAKKVGRGQWVAA